MATKHTAQINVQRFSLISSRSFDGVLKALEAGMGHPDMAAFRSAMIKAKTYSEVEEIVSAATGASGFMEFTRFDLGVVLRKRLGPKAPRNVRFVVGNPVIMNQMLEHVPDTGSYAPVNILLDERPDGVHLSYDTVASFLASYGNPRP
jgi:uncharacterized protein (DUF302 family)